MPPTKRPRGAKSTRSQSVVVSRPLISVEADVASEEIQAAKQGLGFRQHSDCIRRLPRLKTVAYHLDKFRASSGAKKSAKKAEKASEAQRCCSVDELVLRCIFNAADVTPLTFTDERVILTDEKSVFEDVSQSAPDAEVHEDVKPRKRRRRSSPRRNSEEENATDVLSSLTIAKLSTFLAGSDSAMLATAIRPEPGAQRALCAVPVCLLPLQDGMLLVRFVREAEFLPLAKTSFEQRSKGVELLKRGEWQARDVALSFPHAEAERIAGALRRTPAKKEPGLKKNRRKEIGSPGSGGKGAGLKETELNETGLREKLREIAGKAEPFKSMVHRALEAVDRHSASLLKGQAKPSAKALHSFRKKFCEPRKSLKARLRKIDAASKESFIRELAIELLLRLRVAHGDLEGMDPFRKDIDWIMHNVAFLVKTLEFVDATERVDVGANSALPSNCDAVPPFDEFIKCLVYEPFHESAPEVVKYLYDLIETPLPLLGKEDQPPSTTSRQSDDASSETTNAIGAVVQKPVTNLNRKSKRRNQFTRFGADLANLNSRVQIRANAGLRKTRGARVESSICRSVPLLVPPTPE